LVASVCPRTARLTRQSTASYSLRNRPLQRSQPSLLLSVIRRLFKIAVQDAFGDTAFSDGLAGYPRESYLSQGEFDAILQRSGYPSVDLEYGWRISAACKLEWRDVNLEEGYAILRRDTTTSRRRWSLCRNIGRRCEKKSPCLSGNCDQIVPAMNGQERSRIAISEREF
jgi:integrase